MSEPTYTHRHNATGVRAYILATTADGLLLMRHEHEGDTHGIPAAELDVLYTAAGDLCVMCRQRAATHLRWCAACFRMGIVISHSLADVCDGVERRETTAE